MRPWECPGNASLVRVLRHREFTDSSLLEGMGISEVSLLCFTDLYATVTRHGLTCSDGVS